MQPFHARRIAELTLCATLFLSGLIFMPHAQHVFWAPENFAARLLAPMAALIILASQAPKAPNGVAAKSPYQTGTGILYWLIGSWFLSAAFAFRTDLAARELALWLAAPLVFSATWYLADTARMRGRLIFFIMTAALFQAGYGLIQCAGWEHDLASAFGPHAFGFDQLNWAVSFGGRAGGFLGNPNFLGGHLSMLLPLSLAMAMDDSSGGWRKNLKWILAMVIAAGLVVTQTRGAWLGACFGLALLFFICHKTMPGLLTRHRIGLASFAAVGIFALAIFTATHLQSLRRISSIFSGDEEISRRMVLMRCSLSLAAERPLLGVGPGNFRIFFPSVQGSGLKADELNSRPYIFSEHAHNDFIQMAADAGFPATILLMALVTWVCLTLWKKLRQGREAHSLLIAGILSGLTALEIHALANFPFLIAPTQMTAWCLAAIGLKVSDPPRLSTWVAPWKNSGLKKSLFLLALGVFCISVFDAGREMMEDGLWWTAQGEQSLGHNDIAEPLIRRTLDLDPKEDRLWYLDATIFLKLHMPAQATPSLQRAIALNPHFEEARVDLGRVYVNADQYSDAEQILSPVAAEAPNFDGVWEPMADNLFMQGKYEQAIQAYDSAIYFHATTAQMLENKAASQGSLGHFTDALATLDQAESLSPGRPQNYVNRAITHAKMGLVKQAHLDLIEAARRDPSNQEIKALMKEIR